MRGFFFQRGGSGRDEQRRFGHRDGFGGRGFGGFDSRRMERGMGDMFGGGRGRRDGRGLGHGGLRLVLLSLLSEKPSHGYELIKTIEERFKGAYVPSPGVIYPTLSWLEDEGYVTVAAGDDGRKQGSITESGLAFLKDNADQVKALIARLEQAGGDQGDYAPLFRAMHNLKAALKMRGLKPLSQAEIEAIVDLIDETAKKIERI